MIAAQKRHRTRTVKRSTHKILTTHVGSLPEPVVPNGSLHDRVAAIVRQQRETGIDVINEGECAKGGDWLSYLEERFSGFEQRPPKGGLPVLLQGKDRAEFADFYRYASERGTLYYTTRPSSRASARPVRTGPARGRFHTVARRRCGARSRRLPQWSSPAMRF